MTDRGTKRGIDCNQYPASLTSLTAKGAPPEGDRPRETQPTAEREAPDVTFMKLPMYLSNCSLVKGPFGLSGAFGGLQGELERGGEMSTFQVLGPVLTSYIQHSSCKQMPPSFPNPTFSPFERQVLALCVQVLFPWRQVRCGSCNLPNRVDLARCSSTNQTTKVHCTVLEVEGFP